MATLEYYSFKSKSQNKVALENYRKLALSGLQKFKYDSLGYAPRDKWQYHNDRVSILSDYSPDGYFDIFNKITGLILDLINTNLTLNDKTIPDISVGLAWGKYWEEQKLSNTHGARIKFTPN